MADFIQALSDWLWTYILIGALLGCGIYFTIRTRGVQFRLFGESVRIMLGRDKIAEGEGGGRRSKVGSFQAFAVSLASRVGTGNLAGVASAIFIGGPGSIFWMWVMALLGSATAFMEATLAQLFKKRGRDSFYGGPAYYMETGLGRRWMGIVFSILMIFTFSVANQTVQSNTLSAALADTFSISQLWVGVVVAALTVLIISGGIKRISSFTSILVPIMALGYILFAIYAIFANLSAVPSMLRLIVDCAFGFDQAAGGAVGMAIITGVRRGLFSNEAGEGSAPNAAAIADTSHPVKQGLIQSLGVFVDTIIICTCTAFIILLSGVYDCGEDGIILTSRAFESHIGVFGKYFLTAAIFLFAFSTMIANYYYGESNILFMTRKKWAVWTLRIATFFILTAGAILPLQTTWRMVDLWMAFLTTLNLCALLLLSGKVFRLLSDYTSQKKRGIKEPVFHKEQTLPEIQDRLECW